MTDREVKEGIEDILFNWDWLNETNDVIAVKIYDFLFKQAGYVQLAEDQSLPNLICLPLMSNEKTKVILIEVYDWWDDVALVSYLGKTNQQNMVDKGFRRIRLI